ISRYFSDLQYYFQVNDHYVRNKLKVVLFPFLHRGHWTRTTEPVGGRLSYKPPIYDINAPDLYIPLMAFGTYVVLAGFSLGLQGKRAERCLEAGADMISIDAEDVCRYADSVRADIIAKIQVNLLIDHSQVLDLECLRGSNMGTNHRSVLNSSLFLL
ncbi:YIF1B-like protein, partial [Tanacetum coccineum]